jgi:hypothetical protein
MIFIHALLYTIDVTNIPVIRMPYESAIFMNRHKPIPMVSQTVYAKLSKGIEFFSNKICAISSQMKHL